MRLHIDHPALQNGKAKDPVTSGLTIQGWATARQGVARVEVYLDSQSAGLAYYGQRREDIAGVFPDWDNSLLSGFGFRLPSHFVQRLRPGEHQVEVRLIAKTRAETSLSFSFERAEEQQDIPLFRERISGREVSLYEDVLDALDWHPLFRVVLLPAGEQEPNAELAPTLTSLAGQVYGKWELLTTVDIPPDSVTELSNTPVGPRRRRAQHPGAGRETFSRSDSRWPSRILRFRAPRRCTCLRRARRDGGRDRAASSRRAAMPGSPPLLG
jgi:hypothetical protein